MSREDLISKLQRALEFAIANDAEIAQSLANVRILGEASEPDSADEGIITLLEKVDLTEEAQEIVNKHPLTDSIESGYLYDLVLKYYGNPYQRSAGGMVRVYGLVPGSEIHYQVWDYPPATTEEN